MAEQENDGSDVFTCEYCDNGLALYEAKLVSGGTEWWCSDCIERGQKLGYLVDVVDTTQK